MALLYGPSGERIAARRAVDHQPPPPPPPPPPPEKPPPPEPDEEPGAVDDEEMALEKAPPRPLASPVAPSADHDVP
jgi:hypothetical protein